MRIACNALCELKDLGVRACIEIEEQPLDVLGKMEIPVTHDYYASFRRPRVPTRRTSVAEYLEEPAGRWSDEAEMCPETPLGRAFVHLVRLYIAEGKAWTQAAVALAHAGRTYCVAPVHFDWDHSWVAHACLVGRKRFLFFPPESGWLLNPVINTSALAIAKFTEADRREFLERTGGREVILEAGKGILFPSMCWHGVLYESPSLSISVRFEQVPGGRPFAVLPRSPWLQRLVWRFFKNGYDADAEQFLESYLEVFFQKSSWKNRYRHINVLCRQALLGYGEQQGAAELVGENFSAELALAAEELKFYYGDVYKLAAPIDIEKTVEYLFEGLPHMPAAAKRLAAYALAKRQGLPPQRGQVAITRQERRE